MSATGRQDCRRLFDDYPTPGWCVDRLLDRLPLPGGKWLEPGAGRGWIISAVNEWRAAHSLPAPTWDAIEINPAFRPELAALDCRKLVFGDFLDIGSAIDADYDVIIGNPPFSLAEPFICEARRRARIVVLFLRLNFLGSEGRQGLLEADHPDLYVLPNRPAACTVIRRNEAGKIKKTSSDSCEYGWFVWSELRKARGSIERLDVTPTEVRAAWKARIPVLDYSNEESGA